MALPADIDAACFAVAGPNLPGEVSCKDCPRREGEGWRRQLCSEKYWDGKLHSIFLQTNHTLTCPLSAAVVAPSSGDTVPTHPIELPYGGFFRGERGVVGPAGASAMAGEGDNTNANLRQRRLAVQLQLRTTLTD